MARLNFVAVKDLQDLANDLLHSPILKKTIFNHGQEKWVHEISEASLKMLETCGNTRDVLLFAKDHLHDLQSAFRRSGNKFSTYSHERKKLKKAMLRRLNSLKEMKNKCINSDINVTSINQNLKIVVNVLREVRMTIMVIVESLMSLIMSIPNNPNRPMKSNKGFFESKLLTRVDSLSFWENCDRSTLQETSKRLEAVEIAIEDLEQELDCIFKRLIQTRVLLLNILTTH
ncbi:hypothetical protein ACH5RR_035447 [Cinchona calisaya]|uniref:Uncharacterized protein n=1 Tax=Cinchona calisaya TaxID=153742 RepID=A0ABD2Y0I3_9GENT